MLKTSSPALADVARLFNDLAITRGFIDSIGGRRAVLTRITAPGFHRRDAFAWLRQSRGFPSFGR